MITTARLFIREFTDNDLSDLHSLVAHPEVMRFSDGVESEDKARIRLRGYLESYRTRGYGKWALEERETQQVIGYCGFGVEEFDQKTEPELGFRLLPEYWGRGLASEAAAGCDRYAFSCLGFSLYLGFAHLANHASIRVLEKLGMDLIGDREFHGGPVVVYKKTRKRTK